jgi:protein phosphatase
MSNPEVRTQTDVVRPADDTQAVEPPHPPLLVARCFGITDRGQVREGNEDQFLVATLVKSLEVMQTSLPQPKKRRSSDHSYLLIVADGIGGAAGGEHASALAIESVETYVLETVKWFAYCQENDEDELLTEFRTALGQAHGRLRAEAARKPDLRGMGTTLTLAYSVNQELFVAHVGDSRAYLFRDGSLFRLTQDHTLVDEMLRRGAIKEEEAASHRWRHVITSSVGGTSPSVRIDVHKLHLEAGDVLLLCSDGLTEMLSGEQIAAELAQTNDPQACCRRLVDLANAAGGRDNITVALARYEMVVEGE